ncbi:MAG: DNA polymerase/3'-5' exonuclease PolX [Opitutaceae bacterium]|nr:DNA polymerase/3'-5' exonuclease PolX [Opitutaceae bacterium]
MNKKEVAAILSEIGTLLELKGENPFKIRAYQNGARALETLTEKLEDVIAEGRLNDIKGVGVALAKKIEELSGTGKLKFYTDLRASVPEGLIQMLDIPGLGGKKIKVLHDKLGVESLKSLEEACLEGEVAALPGFGVKSAEKILSGIKNREIYSRRHLWWKAQQVAEPILEGLRVLSEVIRAEHAGSLRRNRETVGDLDFVVASDEPSPVMDWFTERKGVVEITAKGQTKSSVRLENGLQADLRVVSPAQFAFALHHFTGSKEHNVQMRQRALSRGLSLSEWGISNENDGVSVEGSETIDSEEALFHFFDLTFIPPELREGLGEIEVAENGSLPDLVRVEDLKGCFHNHTEASDGVNTLEEMALAAQEMGWDYLGLADHSKASFQANGLNEERVIQQIEAIRALNESGKYTTRVFSGIECDILTDGSLDLNNDVLEELDYVVVSVHASFTQPRDKMTARIIKAIEHPSTTMLGHLTGRLLLAREGYELNVEKVVDAAVANGVIIELNANPHRLDMDWRHWRRAVEKGHLTSINPDAHSIEHLGFVDAGVRIARKGWLSAESVFNTWTLKSVEEFLEKRKK